MKGPSGPTDR